MPAATDKPFARHFAAQGYQFGNAIALLSRMINLTMIVSRFSAIAAGMLVLASAALAQSKPITTETKESVMARVSDLLDKYAYVPTLDFDQWPSFLDSQRKAIDESKTEDEFSAALNGALRKFGASHIQLNTPRNAEIRATASTVGIGIQTQQTEEGLVIVRTYADGSAAKVGLVPGDIITKVDGKPVNGISGIPGEEGTTVNITVKRRSGKVDEYNIVRKKFSIKRPEELTMLDEDTAQITIPTFDLTYDADRVSSLMEKVEGKRNLVLDLRDNGGGAVVNLLHLLGHFIPNDTPIGTFISRKTAADYEKATEEKPTDLAKVAAWAKSKLKPMRLDSEKFFKGNVVVLVNGNSGSAAEMAAAALREINTATVIGKKSAGAVLVSVIVPANNGFTLQYPLSDYITIKGDRLEGNGVVPDIEAKDPLVRLPNAPDEAVKKARETFAKLSKKG